MYVYGGLLFSESESSEVSVKKLKVASASEIYERYEAGLSRISCWADHILTRLDDGLERLCGGGEEEGGGETAGQDSVLARPPAPDGE